MKFTGINHLAMVTDNMDKTIRFWRDLLGMRLVASLGKKGYRHYFFQITQQDMIAFFEWPEVENVKEKDHGVPVKGPSCFDHISFQVEAEEDLFEIKERMEAANFWVSEVIDHGFIHSVYSFDPNNIAIEFSAPVSNLDIGKKPRLKDRHPVKTALEGPEPQLEKWPQVKEPIPEEEKLVFPGEGTVFRE